MCLLDLCTTRLSQREWRLGVRVLPLLAWPGEGGLLLLPLLLLWPGGGGLLLPLQLLLWPGGGGLLLLRPGGGGLLLLPLLLWPGGGGLLQPPLLLWLRQVTQLSGGLEIRRAHQASQGEGLGGL